MKQLHIVTVGISLLTNFAKANNLPLEKALRLHKQLAEFLEADPRAAGSEINSLDARTGLLRKYIFSGPAPTPEPRLRRHHPFHDPPLLAATSIWP